MILFRHVLMLILGTLISCQNNVPDKTVLTEAIVKIEDTTSYKAFLNCFPKEELPFSLYGFVDDDDYIQLSKNLEAPKDIEFKLIPKHLAMKWIFADSFIHNSGLSHVRENIDLFYEPYAWHLIEGIARFGNEGSDMVLLGIYEQNGVNNLSFTHIKAVNYSKQGKILGITDLGSYGRDRQNKPTFKGSETVLNSRIHFTLMNLVFNSMQSVVIETRVWEVLKECHDSPIDTCYEKTSVIRKSSKNIRLK
jgi:hypothetical protein